MEILESSLVERIVDEALSVLEKTGVLVEHDEAFDRLVAAGFTGNTETKRITFPRTIVEEALASAPSSLTLYDRDGQPYTTLEGDNVHFVPASSALRILDRKTGEIREPQTADYVDYVKIANGLENISYLSTAFIPKDVPQDMADAWRLYMVLSYSKKPIVSGAFTAFGVPRMGEIMSYFRKDRDDLAAKPLSIFTCCPNTPLRWGEDPITNVIDCAEWGIPIEIVPVLLLGMISPATTVGALVLHTAEVVSGITIAQRIRPGTPVLFGGAPASFHMKLMTNPMTAVEALQVYCGYAQIAKQPEASLSGLYGALGLEAQRLASGRRDRHGRDACRARGHQLGLGSGHARLRELFQPGEARVRRRARRARAPLPKAGRSQG